MIIETEARIASSKDGEFTYKNVLINTDHIMTVLPSDFKGVVNVVMPGGNMLARTGYETFLNAGVSNKLAAVPTKKGKR